MRYLTNDITKDYDYIECTTVSEILETANFYTDEWNFLSIVNDNYEKTYIAFFKRKTPITFDI